MERYDGKSFQKRWCTVTRGVFLVSGFIDMEIYIKRSFRKGVALLQAGWSLLLGSLTFDFFHMKEKVTEKAVLQLIKEGDLGQGFSHMKIIMALC